MFKGCIMFASEMKAFMGLGWQAEWDIDSIVHSGDFGGERTVFKGAQKVGIYLLTKMKVGEQRGGSRTCTRNGLTNTFPACPVPA